MRTVLLMLAFSLLVALPATVTAQTAQDLDCGTHLKAAETAIDKATEDMKGMEHMGKNQVGHVNTLLREAKDLSRAAQQACDKPRDDYDRARAIAKAEAARGSAEAADILHWHYMKAAPGMKGMKSSSDKAGEMSGMKDMSGMKK